MFLFTNKVPAACLDVRSILRGNSVMPPGEAWEAVLALGIHYVPSPYLGYEMDSTFFFAV